MANYREGVKKLPQHMQSGIVDYIEKGVPAGQFLELIIKNDYPHAAEHADMINLEYLLEYMNFFLYSAPAACWGSKENYDTWVAQHGLNL